MKSKNTTWKRIDSGTIEVYNPYIDYFEKYDLLPENVYNLIMQTGELDSYKDTMRLQQKLENIGWTFDYYLDNTPYALRPIGTESEIYKKGGEIIDELNFKVHPTDADMKMNKGGKVSDKIRLLRKEGYPQDQAVAIALSMRDSGKLAKGGLLEHALKLGDEIVNEVDDKVGVYNRIDKRFAEVDLDKGERETFRKMFAKGGEVSEEENWNNFYERNPEKILGDYVETKTKFGKMVKVLKGEKDILDKIETPDYRVQISNDFGLSESSEQVTENTIEYEKRQTQIANNDEDKQTLVNVIQAEERGDLDSTLFTFDEVDKTYNKGITDIEKCAFVTYLEKKTGKPIQGGFSKYKNMFTLKQMFDRGELMFDFDSFEFQPKFLFLSGNISNKYGILQRDKDKYVERYGEKAYNKAFELLSEVYKEVQSKYLTLDNPEESLRLKILIGSKFSKNTIISGYKTFERFGSKEQFKSVEKNEVKAQGSYTTSGDLKKIDFAKADIKWNKTHYFSRLTLFEGFQLWLRDAGDPNSAKEKGIVFRNGTSARTIISTYINKRPRPKELDKTDWTRIQGYNKENGDRLFAQFLAEFLSEQDRRNIEINWNNTYNSTIEYDTSKVPIGFRFTRFFGEGIQNDIRPEKRQAIAYWLMRGSCLFAYGVGIGKTWCSIFTIAQAMELGLTKRPLIIVPKQVYVQFSKEIRKILGSQYEVNTLYNLSLNKDRKTKITFLDKGSQIKDNTISICTYDALDNLGFSDEFNMEFYSRIASILDEDNGNLTDRQREKAQEKYFEMIGKAKEGGVVEIDSPNTNFDFVAVDEAHNFKKLFTSVKGEAKGEQKSDRVSREKHPYQVSSGVQSKMAIKLFFITQYIQSKAKTGNCLLLTATPFTNTPLEIYSMLAFINYNKLRETGFDSLKSFFDTFADMQTQLTINTQLQPVRKQVFVGFNNLVAMQSLIRNMIDKKSREDEDKLVERPNKIVLPFRNVMKKGINYPVAQKNQISTTLAMTERQFELAERLKEYAKGKDQMGAGIDFEDLCLGENINETKYGKLRDKLDKLQAKQEADESDVTLSQSELEKEGNPPNESAGVRSLQCLTYMRQLALNPYLYACSGYKVDPTYKEFVESSPKMLYAFECIKSVKEYEKENGLLQSGQVVYMDFGTDAFNLLVEYAVKELGYDENEVGYITGTDFRIGKKSQKDKADVQDAFLGRKFNEDIQEYELIPEKDRCKLLFGSSSIREGMNLQFYASCLYNLYIDFNPTDNTQLEGRIWRQGNRFENVRIVVPLMENSMDIFMFQKLEEKTERINQIWNYDGQTNELNTQDFNPAELKYELITDPLTIATLEVDDKVKELDEKINDKLINRKSLNNFINQYDKIKDFNKKFKIGNPSQMEDNIPVQMYYYLSAFRPDLVPLPFLKDDYFIETTLFSDQPLTEKELSTYTRGEKNDLIFSTGRLELERPNRPYGFKHLDLSQLSDSERNKYLNYDVKELIDKVVEFHKDQKFSFPPNYKFEETFKVGDKVLYETKRGKKKGVIESENPDGTFDVDIKVDIIEDVSKNKLSLEKGKKVSSEPFNPFTKNKENLLAFSQIGATGSSREKFKDFYGTAMKVLTFPPDFTKSDLSEIEKFQEFRDKRKEGRYVDYWNIEYPLIYKKIETFEKNNLRPLGINNLDELNQAIQNLTDEIADLEVQQKAFSEEENLKERANIIKERMDMEAKSGLRKPSTYTQRAEEFKSVNSDYYGNEYLLLLSQKELIGTIDTLTALRQTETYKELSKEDRAEFEKRFTKKKKEKESKAKTQKDDTKQKAIDVLEKRIKAVKIALKLNPKNKKAQKQLKALEIVKRFPKNN